MKLTDHQTRIVAALLELERRYSRRWWSRDAIGFVVGAGGYHTTIQKRTMLALSDASLTMLEVESWTRDTRRLVKCTCAAYRWGLTDAGRSLAEVTPIRWTEEAQKLFASVHEYECHDAGEGRTTKGDRFVSSEVIDGEFNEDELGDF